MDDNRLEHLLKFIYGDDVKFFVVPPHIGRFYAVASLDEHHNVEQKYVELENIYVFKDLDGIGDIKIAVGYLRDINTAFVRIDKPR